METLIKFQFDKGMQNETAQGIRLKEQDHMWKYVKDKVNV